MSEKGWSDLSTGEKIVGLPLALIFVSLIIMGEGYCTKLLWNWYAEPIVNYKLNLAHAIGLNFLAGVFIFQWPKKDHVLDASPRRFLSVAVGYALATLVGYFLHFCI